MALQDAIWHKQYDLLFQSISDGAMILDRDGIILRMNSALAAMLRCDLKQSLGQAAEATFNHQPGLLALISGAAGTSQRIPLPDKRVAVGVIEDQPGGGRLLLLRDVTERESLESRREQLIERLAHDLRSPISAIEGFGDLIAMYGPLNDEQHRFLTRIRQTSKKLQNLIHNLVDLTWIEAGMPMSSVPVHLDQVISEAVIEVSEMAQQHRVALATSTQQPMPVVMGDPLRLRQVVRNLLQNAILYSSAEQAVAIHAFVDGRLVQCSIADQGIGIPDSEQGLVFDRLYRVQNDTVRSLPGGGIGLTMAREIVQRHGGAIHVESMVGLGSTFTFTLPLAENP